MQRNKFSGRKEAWIYPQCLEEYQEQSRCSVNGDERMNIWETRAFFTGQCVLLGEVGMGVGEAGTPGLGSRWYKWRGKTGLEHRPAHVQWRTLGLHRVNLSIWWVPSHCILWNKFPKYWKWTVSLWPYRTDCHFGWCTLKLHDLACSSRDRKPVIWGCRWLSSSLFFHLPEAQARHPLSLQCLLLPAA